MPPWTDMLFYIAFLGQIFLISLYYPEVLRRRMKYVLETYPPAKYPRLYPKPVEYYKLGQWLFNLANRCIFVLGFVVLFAIAFVVDHSTFADDGYISEFWPMAYGALQFVPILALEIAEHSHLKLMRQARVAGRRSADLRRRGVFQFVSPTALAAAGLLVVAAILVDFHVHGYAVQWNDSMQRALVLIATNVLFAATGAWSLYGRRQDPYQDANDRKRKMEANLRPLPYISMAVSLFFLWQAVEDLFAAGFLDATLMSLYFQVTVVVSLGYLLRNYRLEDIDFEVYRAEPALS